jgi:hypothetical protein
MKIKHSVWPTGVPPVCTAYWDQSSWDKFADSFRPEDYHGGRFDASAWAEYVERKSAEVNEALYHGNVERWKGLPDENVEWLEARTLLEGPGDYEIEELPNVFVLIRGLHREAVIFWGSQDAREAQLWLKKVSFARCSVSNCGIRLGEGQKIGDMCRNHRR